MEAAFVNRMLREAAFVLPKCGCRVQGREDIQKVPYPFSLFRPVLLQQVKWESVGRKLSDSRNGMLATSTCC